MSGVSSDMRTLLASDEPRAKFAIELFAYRIGRELGSLAAALGGLDALVFTGGIGEHAAPVRAQVLRAAAWLGVEARRRGQRSARPAAVDRREPRVGVGDPHQRGTDDRPAHARAARGLTGKPVPEETAR